MSWLTQGIAIGHPASHADGMEPFFDLASLTKPLVTAPLALKHLDLDADRREALGFTARTGPLTVRQLLSHTAGLPPWLPFTGEGLADQLRRGLPEGAHPLLRQGVPGTSVYSDLGFRLLGELLEQSTHCPWRELGAEATGLIPAPYSAAPVALPDAQDAAAWRVAAPERPLPLQASDLPHDVNARAGMIGHAGFGGTPTQVRAALERWWAAGWPRRMAMAQAQAEDGLPWGLGLHRIPAGPGRFGELLDRLPAGLTGIHVQVDTGDALAEPAPALGALDFDTSWWGHFGFTGGALFLRPDTGLTICLLVHRRGPQGELLDVEALRARRWRALEDRLSTLR